MTNKKEKKAKSISIFFDIDKIPKRFKKYAGSLKDCEVSNENFVTFEKNIYVFLNKLYELNNLQKNYYLLDIGNKLAQYCDESSYSIKFFGGKDLYKNNLYLGWQLSRYEFTKFKSIQPKRKIGNLIINSEKKIKDQAEVFHYIRDLINTPANVLGPTEIYMSAKKYLKKDFNCNVFSDNKLKKEFPLISEVGNGASSNKKPMLCEFYTLKKKRKTKL